jgi:hypothetical protein
VATLDGADGVTTRIVGGNGVSLPDFRPSETAAGTISDASSPGSFPAVGGDGACHGFRWTARRVCRMIPPRALRELRRRAGET